VVESYSDHGFNEVRNNGARCGWRCHNKLMVFGGGKSSSSRDLLLHTMSYFKRFLSLVVRWRYWSTLFAINSGRQIKL